MNSLLDADLHLIKPKVIGVVITQVDHKINLCPVNWEVVSSVYEKPLVVCVGLSHGSYTLETIQNTKEFVYAYPAKDQLKDILYCGTVSGRNVDKTQQTKLFFGPSKSLRAPLLKNAVLNLECKLIQEVDMVNFSIIIGEVISGHSTKSPQDKIYALGGDEYGIIDKVKVLQKGRL